MKYLSGFFINPTSKIQIKPQKDVVLIELKELNEHKGNEYDENMDFVSKISNRIQSEKLNISSLHIRADEQDVEANLILGLYYSGRKYSYNTISNCYPGLTEFYNVRN